mmetsp:Transcript_17760/g.49993  ORF Transcript_17760/g.49993 Transcript_17760/m.49993 type:complete len:259 (-) Transcript_17760:1801-2577(-)
MIEFRLLLFALLLFALHLELEFVDLDLAVDALLADIVHLALEGTQALFSILELAGLLLAGDLVCVDGRLEMPALGQQATIGFQKSLDAALAGTEGARLGIRFLRDPGQLFRQRCLLLFHALLHLLGAKFLLDELCTGVVLLVDPHEQLTVLLLDLLESVGDFLDLRKKSRALLPLHLAALPQVLDLLFRLLQLTLQVCLLHLGHASVPCRRAVAAHLALQVAHRRLQLLDARILPSRLRLQARLQVIQQRLPARHGLP